MLTRLSTLAIGTAFVAIPVTGLFGRDSRQDDVGEHSEPKGIGADDRNVGKDANDRHHEDDKRHQKSKIHRVTSLQIAACLFVLTPALFWRKTLR